MMIVAWAAVFVPAATAQQAAKPPRTPSTQPSAKDPLVFTRSARWTADDAAHLLRRAGFGGTPEQINRLTRMGREKAVRFLIDYDTIPQTDADYPIDGMIERPPRSMLASLDKQDREPVVKAALQLGRQYVLSMREWWLHRMAVTPRPLEEKMTLFWHSLLTSGVREVKQPKLMMQQNAFLRKHAMSDFGSILHGISRDPAMLVYLDNASNVRSHPNENYARELLELFSLGEGNYTEQDVVEAARAFTGWTQVDGQFVARRRQHDSGVKTFLGRRGNFDGDDIVDIILEQPAASRHFARELWTFFVEPEPSDEVVEALAARLRASDYNVREAMRAIFMSDAFYAPQVKFALIKSPTELLVGTVRLLEVEPKDLVAAHDAMAKMGQELFQPPNVKGWDGGRAWISASYLFVRYNAPAGIVFGSSRKPRGRMLRGFDQAIRRVSEQGELPEAAKEWLDDLEPPPRFDDEQVAYNPMPALEKLRLTSADEVVDHYVKRLLQQPISNDRRRVLVRALEGQTGDFDARDQNSAQAVRQLIHLIVSMPEYQMN